jgi:hypothetical protein
VLDDVLALGRHVRIELEGLEMDVGGDEVADPAQGLDWLRLDGPGKAGLTTDTPAGTYRLAERPRESLMSPEMRRALP